MLARIGKLIDLLKDKDIWPKANLSKKNVAVVTCDCLFVGLRDCVGMMLLFDDLSVSSFASLLV